MKLVLQHNCKKRISLVCENWKHEFMKKSLYCTDPARHTFHNNLDFLAAPVLVAPSQKLVIFRCGFRYKVECPREMT